MIERNTLVTYLNKFLAINDFKDKSNNGVQVEGNNEINNIVIAVDASEAAILKAIEQKADFMIVHHGLFWEGTPSILVGPQKRKIKLLLDNNITLYAVHLPLDAHEQVGNNAQLVKQVHAILKEPFLLYEGQYIGWTGKFDDPQNIDELAQALNIMLNATCEIIKAGKEQIKTIAVCSGAAGNQVIEEAATLQIDCLIIGEKRYIDVAAHEHNISIIMAGHYPTETVGIKALANIIKQQYQIEPMFVDIPSTR